MILLSHRAPKLCPTCQHPATSAVGRLVEPLIWAEACCHELVEDPWSYHGGDECGCRDETHGRRRRRRTQASRAGAY